MEEAKKRLAIERKDQYNAISQMVFRLKKMSEEKEYVNSSSSAYNTTTSTCSSSDFSDASLYGTIGARPSEARLNLKSDLNALKATSTSNLTLNTLTQDQLHNLSPRVTEGGSLNLNNKSQSLETVNPNVASVRAMADRVLHKPPIAEKPKVCSAGRIPTNSRPNNIAKKKLLMNVL